MQRNIDYVNYNPKVDTSLVFTIVGKATKVSEEFDEILDIIKKVFEITEGFYEPTEIRYGLYIYNEDTSVYTLIEFLKSSKSKIKPFEILERVIQSKEGVSFEDFIDDIQKVEIKGRIKTISGIGCIEGKTRFFLKGKDEYIDKNSKGLYEIIHDGKVLDIPNKEDPIKISISRSIHKSESKFVENMDTAYYEIVFQTYTDMWFTDSDIELANRSRFKKVLKEIYNSFDVAFTLYLSDLYSSNWLKDVIPNLSE